MKINVYVYVNLYYKQIDGNVMFNVMLKIKQSQ